MYLSNSSKLEQDISHQGLDLNLSVLSSTKRRQRSAFFCYRKSGFNADREFYITSKKETAAIIRRAKQDYEDKLVESLPENRKCFFNYCTHFNKFSTVDTIEYNGEKVTDDDCKAELLNDFFISVLVQEPEETHLPNFNCDKTN